MLLITSTEWCLTSDLQDLLCSERRRGWTPWRCRARQEPTRSSSGPWISASPPLIWTQQLARRDLAGRHIYTVEKQSQHRPVDGLEDFLCRDAKGFLVLVLPLSKRQKKRVNIMVIKIMKAPPCHHWCHISPAVTLPLLPPCWSGLGFNFYLFWLLIIYREIRVVNLTVCFHLLRLRCDFSVWTICGSLLWCLVLFFLESSTLILLSINLMLMPIVTCIFLVSWFH